MPADSTNFATTKSAVHPPGVRARRAAWPLDGRTKESRKLRRLVAELGARFGVDVDDLLLQRAAQLTLAAEMARRELIRNVPGASVEALVKIENLSARAVRDLSNRAKDKPSNEPSLQQYLAQLQAEEAVSTVDAFSDAVGTETPGDDADRASGPVRTSEPAQ